MPSQFNDTLMRWTFESVQEFWDAQRLEEQAAYVQQGNLVGKLQKGLVDNGQLRELRSDDIELDVRPDTLIVVQVNNLDRRWNWDRLQNPPPRTGLFAAFMDEVEEVAAGAGCRHVWVEKVANEFLPEKLESRGYKRLNDPDGFPNPDYVKFLW